MISLEDLPPEIVDVIISLCSHRDLTVATRVCQAWQSIMQPVIWRTIIIDNPTDFHRFKDSNRDAAAVKRNSHLIRHLRTRYFSILDELLITLRKAAGGGCPEEDVASITPALPKVACVNLESLFVDSESDPDVPKPFPHRLIQQEIQRAVVSNASTMASVVAFGGQLPGSSCASSSAAFSNDTMAAKTTIPPPPPFALSGQPAGSSSVTAGAFPASTMIAPTPMWTPAAAPFGGQIPGPSSAIAGALQANTVVSATPIVATLSAIANPPHDLSFWRREIPKPPPPPPLDPTNLSIVLCSNSGLKAMTLQGRAVDEDHVFSQVIQDLPSGIEFLSIKGTMDRFNNTTTYDKLDLNDSSPDEQTDRFYKLQEIRIGGGKIDNQIIARIIQQSSALKTFRLLTKTTISSQDMALLLRNHCGNLRELYLDDYHPIQPESDAALVDYLSMSTKGWITIGVPTVHFGPLSVAALLKHTATLENLMIQGCSGISSSTIQQILTTATNLKRLRALTPYRSAHSSVIALDANDLVRSKWVCLGLETFRCQITGVPRPDIRHKMNGRPLAGRLHGFSMQDSYHVHRQVYEQLSALTKLKELRLGFSIWDYGWRENFYEDDDNEVEYSDIAQQNLARQNMSIYRNLPRHLELGRQYECLALTLDSALDILRTLTELEVIDFRRMQIGFWRETEQLWARDHWKKLRAPYREFPFVDEDYKDPFWKPLDELDEMTREDEYVYPDYQNEIMHLYVPPAALDP